MHAMNCPGEEPHWLARTSNAGRRVGKVDRRVSLDIMDASLSAPHFTQWNNLPDSKEVKQTCSTRQKKNWRCAGMRVAANRLAGWPAGGGWLRKRANSLQMRLS
ncbi:hypothetical protein Y032_0186g1093 [Ancylostoma ceylanicum]|uniref:Uncharacterized protein n=1 Tax=Ancylostoma ceylanicum TaxID=53326 RepID=A0A016SRZ2_9BILA|nr:hypothetical protein Y032_0186g1093 [Ancylostoma ceylanicum]